jgi:hypothetical protein
MRFRTFVAAVAIVAVFPASGAAFQVPLLLGPACLVPDLVDEQAVPRPPIPPAPVPPNPRPLRLVPQRYPYPPPYPVPRRPRPQMTERERSMMLVFLTVVGGAVLLRAARK